MLPTLYHSVPAYRLKLIAANIGAIQFVSSDLDGSSIVLKGPGGLSREESALPTVSVLDQNERDLAGVDVDFSTTTDTGGLSCRDWNTTIDGPVNRIAGLAGASCSAQVLNFRLHDVNNNPLPKDTTVTTVDVDKVAPGTMSNATIPSTTAIGGTDHSVIIKPDSACAAGSFGVLVKTPTGVSSGPYNFQSN